MKGSFLDELLPRKHVVFLLNLSTADIQVSWLNREHPETVKYIGKSYKGKQKGETYTYF